MTYGQPERDPRTAQTESDRIARHHNNKKQVPDYSNEAGERNKRKRQTGAQHE